MADFLCIETPLERAEDALREFESAWLKAQNEQRDAVRKRGELETALVDSQSAEKSAAESGLPDLEPYAAQLRRCEDALRHHNYRAAKLDSNTELAREAWVAASEAVTNAKLGIAFEENSALADDVAQLIETLKDTCVAYIRKTSEVAGLLAALGRPGSSSSSADYARANVQRVLQWFLVQALGDTLQMPGGKSHGGQQIFSASDLQTYLTSDRDGTYSPITLIR